MPKKTPKTTLKIYPKAQSRIVDIWKYTHKTWGKKQADKYVRGLHRFMEDMQTSKETWRQVPHNALPGVYFARYEHHYVFFKELKGGTLGIMSILHENMDIPNRITEDIN